MGVNPFFQLPDGKEVGGTSLFSAVYDKIPLFVPESLKISYF